MRSSSNYSEQIYNSYQNNTYILAQELEFFKLKLLGLWSIISNKRTAAKEELHRSAQISFELRNIAQDEENLKTQILPTLKFETKLLVDVEDALERIENGTYGYCEMTGQPIGIERLKVLPAARLCIAAQLKTEGKRHRGF